MFRRIWLWRRFSFPKIWIPLAIPFVLVGLLAALFLHRPMASVQAPCSRENLTGTIQTISPGSKPGFTTIGLNTLGTANRHLFGGVDTYISVNASVHVFLQQGTACSLAQQGSLSNLNIGQRARVWSSSGITLLSYPGWLEDVTTMVILE
jgi:hypothetical protein